MALITGTTPTNRFGIKEVADVEFFSIGADGQPSPTASLSFDTLKVSNLEFTSEEAAARGGIGNPKLIVWDYNREITLTLQDALLSMDALQMIFGDDGTDDTEVHIGPATYPGYYKIVGKTYAKTEAGIEKIFTFTIPKAKISSNVTLTMEAEGDPSVFDMTITVLKAQNESDLMTLELDEKTDGASKVEVKLVDSNGSVTSYILTAGSDWPSGVTADTYLGLPAKVTGGTYYAKTTG